MSKLTTEKKNNIKLIVITSVVWIGIAVVAISFVKYGEYKYSEGLLKGVTTAREVLNK